MPNEAPLLRVSDAAKRSGFSVDIVKRDARMGRLQHAQKFDGRTGAYLFTAEQVDAWIARRKAERAA